MFVAYITANFLVLNKNVFSSQYINFNYLNNSQLGVPYSGIIYRMSSLSTEEYNFKVKRSSAFCEEVHAFLVAHKMF